jgi:thymidylate synthase
VEKNWNNYGRWRHPEMFKQSEQMNKLDKQYTDLLQDILDNGVTKQDRTGTGTISVFGRQIRHDMKDGFPLLTTKKMPFKTIVTELLWFLRGDTNIKYLVDNNCHIWNGDAYKRYLIHTIEGVKNGFDRIKGHLDDCLVEFDGSYEHFSNPSFQYGYRPHTQEEFINKIKTDDEFANKWGELGPIYGKQWRSWETKRVDNTNIVQNRRDGILPPMIVIDQIQNLINDLKTNPDSRRLMVNAWNVGELDQMVLPPCHYGFQVYTRELSLDERYDYGLDVLGYEGLLDYGHSQNDDDKILEFLNYGNVPTRAISLMWNQRSVDTFLGLPFNIASYGLLLEIIAKEVNMVPDELIGNLGDVHLYSNHIEQAEEQIGRHYTIEERVALIPEGVLSQESVEYFNLNKRTNSEINVALAKYRISPALHIRQPFPLPTFDCPAMDEIPHTTFDELVFKLQPVDFYMDDYQSHPTIKASLSN